MIARNDWLRIITFNTWKGEGRYRQRLRVMVQQLQKLQPDVICLQEAVRSEDGSIDTTSFLADALRMKSVYAPARKKIRQIEGNYYDCSSGLAVLSHHMICTHSIAILPVTMEDPERIAQQVLLQTESGNQVSITNLHLTHLSGYHDIRLRQLTAACGHFNLDIEPSIRLCCGDFNCTLDDALIYTLQNRIDQQIIDCYLSGRGRLPGYTCGTASLSQSRRIDYILALSQPIEPMPVCANSNVVLNVPDADDCLPSDHFGVMVDIFLGEF